MLTPEQYKAKIEAARIASLAKGKDNGSSEPATNPATIPSETIPASEHKGVSTNGLGLPDNDARGTEQNVIPGSNDTGAGTKSNNSETSPGLQHEGNSEVLSEQPLTFTANVGIVDDKNVIIPTPIIEESIAVIDPSDAYCDECGKPVEDCDCIPSDDEESEASILASLGISKEKQETFKAKESTANDKDISTLLENGMEAGALSAAEIVAREYTVTEDELIVFRNAFNQTHEKVKDLLPDQLEQKVLHLDKVIKLIQAMQQACKRLASDKLEKETAKEKAERKEREKSYKIPRRRGSDEVDSTGALKTKEVGSKTKREKLIATLMLAGLSKEKAEALADGN